MTGKRPAQYECEGFNAIRIHHALLIGTLAITLFLGFIDEGYYNFHFLLDPGAWIALFLYGGFIYGVQVIFFQFVLNKMLWIGKVWSAIITILVVFSILLLAL